MIVVWHSPWHPRPNLLELHQLWKPQSLLPLLAEAALFRMYSHFDHFVTVVKASISTAINDYDYD